MNRKPLARKRFGQNFLTDDSIIDRIIQSLCLNSDDQLLEIGPGRGALTAKLLQHHQQLTAIEIDKDLIHLLNQSFHHYPQFKLIEADALKMDLRELCTEQQPLKIIGNLPYNISTPLLFHLFSYCDIIQDMHFMLQKEVVDRMCADTNNKAYGRLSVMTQYHCRVEALFDVPPEAFIPKPAVMSTIVRLIPQSPKITAQDSALFTIIVREAFNQRRKTLSNSLKKWLSIQALQSLDINPQARAENLSLEQYIQISNFLSK